MADKSRLLFYAGLLRNTLKQHGTEAAEEAASRMPAEYSKAELLAAANEMATDYSLQLEDVRPIFMEVAKAKRSRRGK
jgi:hypothetical protein